MPKHHLPCAERLCRPRRLSKGFLLAAPSWVVRKLLMSGSRQNDAIKMGEASFLQKRRFSSQTSHSHTLRSLQIFSVVCTKLLCTSVMFKGKLTQPLKTFFTFRFRSVSQREQNLVSRVADQISAFIKEIHGHRTRFGSPRHDRLVPQHVRGTW